MQPLRLAADAKASFVHVLDRRSRHEISDRLSEAFEAVRARPAHLGDGGRGKLDAEKIGHQCDQAIFGQQLIMQQIDDEGRNTCAILHGCIDAFGKRRPRRVAATDAAAFMRAMFGDDERLWLGKVEHLAGDVTRRHVRRQRAAAFCAGRGMMIDDLIGLGALPQRFALVAFLAARLFARAFPQALHSRRFFQPVARRWFRTVGAVQSQPALQFRDPLLQHRVLGSQRRNQRNEFLSRRLWGRFASYPIFEFGKPLRRRGKNYPTKSGSDHPTWAVTYQQALMMMGRRGGWPLTMFLTPDGQPFWGGTYFPPFAQGGRPGFAEVLKTISDLWRSRASAIEHNVRELGAGLAGLSVTTPGEAVSPELVETICEQLEQRLDRVDGGFGAAPKFPQATSLDFLWRAWKRTCRNSLRQGVLLTLDHISQGGVYDHLGGGFSRYSTDDRWLVPHFEKMLYDNAQLIDLLTEVWQDERRELYRLRVTETIQWITREMRTSGGGFASSLDADSEGVEGKFYSWSKTEIDEALGARAPFFERTYGVERLGNWEHGRSILNRLGSIELLDEETEAALAQDRAALFSLREGRVRPGCDDKVLADWNGLTIAASQRRLACSNAGTGSIWQSRPSNS